MTKIQISVCPVCREASCDGKIYRVNRLKSGCYGITKPDPDAFFRACSSNEQFRIKKGKPYYHVIVGHGHEYDIDIEEEVDDPSNW